MRLLPSDPDIETIVSRIKSGDIDLQPDFQRGEVWSRSKKQRLVDSILRDWHVPPIHVIEDVQTRKQEVLDGQQRLAAIRDFVDGEFSLDGNIEPADDDLCALQGFKYRDLPEIYRRRFNQFTIRLFRIVDYKPGEPGELFFRLNQPTSLTGAEQRNAFFGPVRSQIKSLVKMLGVIGLDKGFFGFSNSRMAYDDVLSRVAITIDRKSLSAKITSAALIDLYRSEEPLPDYVIELIRDSLVVFSGVKQGSGASVRFNKATLSTWILFLVRARINNYFWLGSEVLAEFIEYFEERRVLGALTSDYIVSSIPLDWLFNVYESRSSARVADVSSVLLRDAIVWLLFQDYLIYKDIDYNIITPQHSFRVGGAPNEIIEDDVVAKHLLDNGWGNLS